MNTMMLAFACIFSLPDCVVDAETSHPLMAGDHHRTLEVGGLKRHYLVHVPKSYVREKPTPVVLALHGAAMNGPMMVQFSGLNKKSDEEGFIVVYPNGTGIGPFLRWNAGGFQEKMSQGLPDDVQFISKLLDELGNTFTVDKKRVYACGMSNGGMMCYRLAAELSQRIAAVAPVAGTVAIRETNPSRPVPVIHLHGSRDNVVPFEIRKGNKPPFMELKGVPESIGIWVKINGCDEKPAITTISPDSADMKVTRTVYTGGKNGTEVVLILVEGGGHTWPGQNPPVGFIGKSVQNVSANDLIWAFFQKHSLK